MYRQELQKINIKYNQPQNLESSVFEWNPSSCSKGCQNTVVKSQPWSTVLKTTKHRTDPVFRRPTARRGSNYLFVWIFSQCFLFVPSFVACSETERQTEKAQFSSSKQEPSPLLTACSILPAENQTPGPITHKMGSDQCTHWNVKLCWHSRWSTILYRGNKKKVDRYSDENITD